MCTPAANFGRSGGPEATASDTMRVRARHLVPHTIRHPLLRGLPLGQDAPHLDGRTIAVGTEARPPVRATSCHPPAPSHRRDNGDAEATTTALAAAHAALDRAAKAGAIHPNAAARRKSRLTLKFNAATGGAHVQTATRVTKTTSKAQAAKAAKSRIAAGKADKAKGAQTAAGKARAALSKTARADAAAKAAAAATTDTPTPSKPAAKAGTARPSTSKTAASKTKTTTKATASKAKSTTTKKAAPKS